MKMSEVTQDLTSIVANNIITKTNYNNPKIVKAVVNNSLSSYEEKLNETFGNAYAKRDNFVLDIIITVVCVVLSLLLLPFTTIINLLIGIGINLIIVFVKNKGFYYLIQECKYRFNKIDYSIDYKPKFGKYEYVIVGLDRSKTIHAALAEDKKCNKLLKTKMYIADKETLGDMINRYKDEDSPSIGNVSEYIQQDILDTYADVSYRIAHPSDAINIDDPKEENEEESSTKYVNSNHF